MARQAALALARPRGLPALSGPRRRALLIGACALALLALLYLGARETPVFAVRTVEVAVVNQASNLWIVSVRGRIIGGTSAAEAPDLPRVRYSPDAPLTAGQFVADDATKTILAALSEAPRRMPLPIHSARLEDGELTLVIAGEGETRPLLLLGEPVDVGTKLRVAALVLRKLGYEERDALAYLDVTLPDRPVASTNPVVSG